MGEAIRDRLLLQHTEVTPHSGLFLWRRHSTICLVQGVGEEAVGNLLQTFLFVQSMAALLY